MSISSFAQLGLNPQNNYVVIGAFEVQQNAINFTSKAKTMHFDAHFDFNPNRGLYYVYVKITQNHEEALAEARRLRVESPFFDSWVYGGQVTEANLPRDVNPVTQENMDVQKSDEVIEPENIAAVSSPPPPPVVEKVGETFIFRIYRGNDNKLVEGDVDLINVEQSKKIGTYKGNTPVDIVPDNKGSSVKSLLCDIFGYRKIQREVDFKDPLKEDVYREENGNVVIPLELIRLKKGDRSIMYHVFFFKDAAVMRPESKYEVNNLLQMLEENPGMKIKIHGHTNGNSFGKIISMDKESKNYFSLSQTKDGSGSAKKLSEERANCIKNYLVSNGVEENRLEIKAWGGKQPIHDKHSTKAGENVRVEIEITSE